nr:hypothetical protein [uncultured Draconibacterium sp.]
MSERIIELAKKLKALADRGVDGEKINAAVKLEALLKKYDLTIEDVEAEIVQAELFEYKFVQKQILIQVIMMVMGMNVKIWGSTQKRNAFIVDCTKSQFIEIQAAFNFYWNAYEEDLRIFNQAFIQKNKLLPRDGGTRSIGEMSDEDKREIRKILNMMDSIDRKQHSKQLENRT